MEYTDLKFSMPHINCTNFKEKDTLVIRNIIKGARLGDMISFSNYGNISFSNEDKLHWNPIVVDLESFTRSKTNCMIFDINTKNKYNKAIIYYSILSNDSYYGLLLYNTENNKCSHVHNINSELTNMLITVYKSIKINEIK